MHSFLDAKTMAKSRDDLQAFAVRQVDLSLRHGLPQRQFGYGDWNILSAKIGEAKSGARSRVHGNVACIHHPGRV